MLGLHLLLAVGLAAFADMLTPLGVLAAFVLSHLVLRLGAGLFGVSGYVARVEAGTRFLAWFVAEVVLASLHVARLALRREVAVTPAVVAVPLESRDERVVTLVAGLLTLTPGTLALDYEPESGLLFVHALDAADAEEVDRAVRELERRLLAWVDGGTGGKR